jgi:membrane-associated protein
MTQLLDLIQHLPEHLSIWTQTMGPWIYVVLFAIVFCETGVVVFPFLPGDSLLFAVGALTAINGALDLKISILTLIAAATLGDTSNYWIGRLVGTKLFTNPNSKIFNPKHLQSTNEFYERHGRKTIFLARFLPIFRTYAPFVAGLGRVSYPRFLAYSFAGSVVWISIFIFVGNRFGNMESVKNNFHFVILGILAVSALPIAIEVLKKFTRKAA